MNNKSRWTPEQELAYLIDVAQRHAREANQGYEGTRTIPDFVAAEIAERVFEGKSGKPFSIKKHAVLTAVSHFAALIQKNKVITASAAHTDLLPIAHPRSTQPHNLHPEQLLQHRARWHSDDPRITDPAVKILIASAFKSSRDSAEYLYASKKLEALDSITLLPLTAAYNGGLGANMGYWMQQVRDSKGQFAEEGGGVTLDVEMPDGTIRKLSGNVVGAIQNPDSSFSFILSTGNGSLYEVPANKAQAVKALLPSQRTPDGFSRTRSRVAEGDPVVKLSDLKKISAPPGYKKDRNWSPNESEVEYYGTRAPMGTMYTDGNYKVRKFNKARDSWLARDDFSVARQREKEGQDVVAIGKGRNGELDLEKPVFFVSRDDERGNRVFAAVQSWEDAMAFARQDESRYQKGELPSPERRVQPSTPGETPSAGEPARPRPSGGPAGQPETRRPVGFEETEPEAAPAPETPKAIRRLAPGDTTQAGDNLDYLPPGTVIDGNLQKNENGTWDQVSGSIGGTPWAKGITPNPADGYKITDIPGYDPEAPGSGITGKVKINAPREGDWVKDADGNWQKIAKLERTRKKRASDRAGRRDMTDETFDYTFENGEGYVAKTTNGGLGFEGDRERLDIVRGVDGLGEAPEAPGATKPAREDRYDLGNRLSELRTKEPLFIDESLLEVGLADRRNEDEIEGTLTRKLAEAFKYAVDNETPVYFNYRDKIRQFVPVELTRASTTANRDLYAYGIDLSTGEYKTFSVTPELMKPLSDEQILQIAKSRGGQQPREMPATPELEEEPITDIEAPRAPESADELPEGGETEVEVTPEPAPAAPAPPSPGGPPSGGPAGAPPPEPPTPYTPVGPDRGQTSSDFTDDPVELAQKFTRAQLRDALNSALDDDSDFATLPFADGDEPVPVDAVWAAIRGPRRTSRDDLRVPPEPPKPPSGTGTSDGPPPPPPSGGAMPATKEEQRLFLDSEIERLTQSGDITQDEDGRLVANTPEAQDILDQSDELDAFEDQENGLPASREDLPSLLQSLSDEELQDYFDTGDYRPYLPKNDETFDYPEGAYVLDPSPALAEDTPPNAFPDRLAVNFTPEQLKTQLSDAIRSGSGYGVLEIENEMGETVEMRVPAEALRDALQLQGEDTNELIRSILSASRRTVPARTPKPRAARKKSTEESPNPTVAYMYKNGRAYISERRGKVFQNNPEVRKYLDDNGFTYLPDGSFGYFETSEMDQASFYNFMRGLRDDFGIDVLPNKGTNALDFDKDPEDTPTPTAASNGIIVAPDQVDALQGLINRRDELDAAIEEEQARGLRDDDYLSSLRRTRHTIQKNIDKIRGVDNGKGPRRVNIPTSGLQKGDIVQSDYFTVESTAPIPGLVWQGQQVYQITGYYPGSKTQSSKKWKADREIPVFRGMTVPEKGDLPEINQPNAEKDFVKLPIKKNMDKYEKVDNFEGRGKEVYIPTDPDLRADFIRAYRSYLVELDRRMALWQPQLEKVNEEVVPTGAPPVVAPSRSVESVSNRDVKPGDVIYTRNADGTSEAFVVENVKERKAPRVNRIIRRKIDSPAGEGQTDANPEQQQWLDEVRQAHSDIDNEDSDMRISALSAALNDEILTGKAKFDRKTNQLKSGDKAQWLIDQIENLANGRDISVGGVTPTDEAFEEITEEAALGVDKVEITGYYPGYASQTLVKKSESRSTVIRGEESLPAKGTDSLPKRPDTRDPDYHDKMDARNAAIREASKDYPLSPEEFDAIKAWPPYKPRPEDRPIAPAFSGRIAEIIEQDEIRTGAELKERLKQERVVYFDFETVGTGMFDSDNPDAPVALAARIYENGELVDTVRLYMNPGEPLSNYYYEPLPRNDKNQYNLGEIPVGNRIGTLSGGKLTLFKKVTKSKWVVEGDEEKSYAPSTLTQLYKNQLITIDDNGLPTPKEGRMTDADGNPITNEWLATQPGVKEQLSTFISKLGPEAILVAYNAEFDVNTLNKWAEKLEIDYTPNGYIDPMGIRKAFTRGQKGENGQPLKNRLEDTARSYGIEKDDYHNAEVDVEVTQEVLDRLLDEIPDFDEEFDIKSRQDRFDYDKAKWERDNERYAIEMERLKQLTDNTPSGDDPSEDPIADAKARGKKEASSIPDEKVEVIETGTTSPSVFGDDVNTEWFKDDENAYNVAPAGEATFNDVVVGDGIATEGGAYNEVVDVLPNPDAPNGTTILHRDLETNRVYETKVADKNTKLTGAPLRRRVELEGLSASEIKQLVNASQKRKTAAAQKTKNPAKPVVKAVTEPRQKKSKEIDAAVESGASTEALEKPTLPGSFEHLDVNNLPLDKNDKVRVPKKPELGIGKVMYPKEGGMVRVKFPDAPGYRKKPTDIKPRALELVDSAEGQRRIAEATRQREAAANKTTEERKVEAITPDSAEGMSRRIKALGSYLVNGPGYSREIGDALKRAARAISQDNLKEAQYWINEAESADKRLKQRNRDTESLRAEFEARRASLTKNPEDSAFTPVVQNYLNRADEFFRGGDTRKALAELTKAEDTFFAYGDENVDVFETGDDRAPAGSNLATQQAYRLFERESVLESARLEKEGVEGKTPLRELTRAQARELLIRLRTTNYEVPNKDTRLAALIDAAESGDYEQFEEIGFSIDFDRQKYLDSQGRSPEGVRSRDESNEEVINEALKEFRKLRQGQQDELASDEKEPLSEEEASNKAAAGQQEESASVTHVVSPDALLPGDVVVYDTPESEEKKSGVVVSIKEMDDQRFEVAIVDDTGNTETKYFNGSDLIEILPDTSSSDPVDNMNYGPPGDGGDGSMNHFSMALPSDSDDPGEDTAADADRPSSQGSEDDFADLEVPATKEQRDILAAALDGKSIAVTAVAGSGKSTTLRLLANVLKDRQPSKKLVYLAFGRDVRAEAETKMPDNTEVRTTGSIAYAGVDKFIREKMQKQGDREKGVPYISTRRAIAKELGIELVNLSMNGQEEEYAPERVAKVIQDAVHNYVISADDELGVEHFDSRFDSIPDELVGYARAYWDDLASPIKQERVDKGNGKFEDVVTEGKFKIDNDHIIKIWALSKPDIFSGDASSGLFKKTKENPNPIPRDIIMIDEAQDINPVVGKVLADQVGQKIYVGDSAQAIYGFRGANDELDKARVDVKLTLTQSFRFGAGVAGVANRLLSLLDARYRVRGSDRPSKINEGIEDPDAILVRENQEGLALSEELLAAGKRVEITPETYANYMSLLASASWLLRGNNERPKPFNMHDDLDLFEDWNDFGAAIGRKEARSGAQFYRLVNNYIKTYGTGNGLRKLEEFLGSLTVNSRTDKPASEYKGVSIDDVTPGKLGKLVKNLKEGGQLDYFITPRGQILVRQAPPSELFGRQRDSVNNRRKEKLRGMGFTWDKTASFPGVPLRDGEETSGAWVRKLSQDEIAAGRTEPEMLPISERKELIDRLGRAFNGFRETDEPTILITTAHKAKGLEWSKVRLSPGFREYGAEFDPATRQFKMPPPEEMNLLYVAVTRAMDELDVGGGGWIYSVTDDDEEDFGFPDPEENVMGMSLPVESTDVGTFTSDIAKAKTQSQEIADQVSALVIKAIEEGGLPPWQKPWSEAGSDGILPFSLTSNKAYKGSNIMILWAAQQINGWTDNRWVTFPEAQRRGGSVKKGEKHTKIYNYSPVIKEVEKEDGTKEKVVVSMRMTVHRVFNVQQTVGMDLPEREAVEPLPVSEAEARLLELYAGAPEVRNSPQDQAFWSPSGDYISMPMREQFATQEAYLETLFHELVHSTGHKSRLDRSDLVDNYGTHRASRGEEELVAEIGAALLAARLGVDLDFKQVAAYAKSWLGPLKNDTSMIVKATRRAQEAVDYMLGGAEPNLGEAGVPGDDVAELIAQQLGLELPQSYVGEYGRSGEEIAREAER